MIKTNWTDVDHLGKKLRQMFNKLDKQSRNLQQISDLTSVANSMGHIAMQIINIKKHSETEEKLEKIQKLLEYIPKDVLAQAMVQVNSEK